MSSLSIQDQCLMSLLIFIAELFEFSQGMIYRDFYLFTNETSKGWKNG